MSNRNVYLCMIIHKKNECVKNECNSISFHKREIVYETFQVVSSVDKADTWKKNYSGPHETYYYKEEVQ